MRHKEVQPSQNEVKLLNHFSSVVPDAWQQKLSLSEIQIIDPQAEEAADLGFSRTCGRLQELVDTNSPSFFEALHQPRRPFAVLSAEAGQPPQSRASLSRQEIIDADTGRPRLIDEIHLTYYASNSSMKNNLPPPREARFRLLTDDSQDAYLLKPVSESRFLAVCSPSGEPFTLEQAFHVSTSEGVKTRVPLSESLYLDSDWYHSDSQIRSRQDQITFSPATDNQPAKSLYTHGGKALGYWYLHQDIYYPDGSHPPVRRIEAANAYWGHQATSKVRVHLEPIKIDEDKIQWRTLYTDIRSDPDLRPTHQSLVYVLKDVQDVAAIIVEGQDLLYPLDSGSKAASEVDLAYVIKFDPDFANVLVLPGQARHQTIDAKYYGGPHHLNGDVYPHAIVASTIKRAFFFNEAGNLIALGRSS